MKINIPRNAYPVIGILIVFVLLELFAPKKIDWTESFNENDKRPFGCFLLRELLEEELFPNQKFEISRVAIFNYPELDKLAPKKNYIFISNDFSPQEWELDQIMSLVENGNQVLIATSNLGRALCDTLNIEFNNDIQFSDLAGTNEKIQNFENPKLKEKEQFIYRKAYHNSSVNKFNKDKLIVLGRDNKKSIQFVKIPIGEGNFFICTQPLAFTNYNIVQDQNANYLAGVFSYLPSNPIVWDEYYKPLRNLRSTSPIVFLLSNPPLKLAYYLLLTCLILVMIFQGKRQQKMIPILKPIPNTSLEFIRTLGRLYFKNKNHKDIALKRIKYLKEFCKSRYHIDLNRNTINEVSKRSGISLKTLEILFNKVEQLSKSINISNEDLEDLNSKIEYIYKSGN